MFFYKRIDFAVFNYLQFTHVLLTSSPLVPNPKIIYASIKSNWKDSFDLHVLGTPPAFVLSQDQTLIL
ncbi:hypothetical protein DY138_05700 [Apilactobacillus timberlakei]|nr:hypothetical protein DY138_05700 [Apilactobacillus timberlakei]